MDEINNLLERKSSDLGENDFLKQLAEKAESHDMLWNRRPERSPFRKWSVFCTKARLIPEIVGRDGSIRPGTDQETIDTVLCAWAAYIIADLKTPYSSAMKLYGQGIRQSKGRGVRVKGCKPALAMINAHRDKHVRKGPPKVASDWRLLKFLEVLSEEIFGSQENPKTNRELRENKSEINHYFMAITEANTELRGASLAPEFVGGEVGRDFIFKRDLKINKKRKTVVVRGVKKQNRAKMCAKVEAIKIPQSNNPKIIGPYKAARVLKKILSVEEKNNYLMKKLKGNREDTAITRRNITTWLSKKSKEPKYKKILAGVKMTSEVLRKQAMILFEGKAPSEVVLRKLTGHSSKETTYNDYITLDEERELEIRRNLMSCKKRHGIGSTGLIQEVTDFE